MACEIVESDELKLARFLASVDGEIYDKLEVQPFFTYVEACKLTLKYDNQRRKKRSFNPQSESRPKYTTNRLDAGTSSSVSKVTAPKEAPKPQRSEKEASTKDLSKIVCFKCQGRGQLMRDCPNPRALSPNENKRVIAQYKTMESEEEDEDAEEEEECYAEDSEEEQRMMLVRRSMQTHIHELTHEQRENF